MNKRKKKKRSSSVLDESSGRGKSRLIESEVESSEVESEGYASADNHLVRRERRFIKSRDLREYATATDASASELDDVFQDLKVNSSSSASELGQGDDDDNPLSFSGIRAN